MDAVTGPTIQCAVIFGYVENEADARHRHPARNPGNVPGSTDSRSNRGDECNIVCCRNRHSTGSSVVSVPSSSFRYASVVAEKAGRKPHYSTAKCHLKGSNAKRPDKAFGSTHLHIVVACSNLRGAIAHVFGAKFRTKIRRVTPRLCRCI